MWFYLFIVLSNILQRKQISTLFKNTNNETTDFETWEVGKNSNYETLHINAETMRLRLKDSQLIVKKPTFPTAKK